MPGSDAVHHPPVARDEPGLFAGAPGPGERNGDGPSDGGQIRLDDLDINPYPAYRALRDEGVVWVEAIQRWLVTRWDDVIAVETDRLSYSAMERDSLQTRSWAARCCAAMAMRTSACVARPRTRCDLPPSSRNGGRCSSRSPTSSSTGSPTAVRRSS